MVEVGKKFSASLLQICFEKSAAALVIAGTGVTVTVTSTGSPEHPFADGVMRYTTVPVEIPSALVNTCPIVFPDPATAPLTFVLLNMVHENVVPATLFGLLTTIAVDWPEQIAWLAAEISGLGLTVTT